MRKHYLTVMLTFLVVLLAYFSYEILRLFIAPISWAVVLSILFYPVYTFIGRYTKMRSLSAFIALAVILLIIIGPALYLSFLLVNEVAALLDQVEAGGIDAIKDLFRHPLIQKALAEIASLTSVSQEELLRAAVSQVADLGRGLMANIAKGIGGVIMAALGFLIMAMTLFFMIRDAPDFLKKVRVYLPFSEEQKDRLLSRAKDMVFSTIYGGVVVAVVQGTAGGVVFALLGLPTAVIWGFIMAIAAFLPVLGPSVVWLPAAIYQFVNDEVMRGIIIVSAGLGIAAIDYFLRPLIIGNRTQMPFLIVFFSVIGGLRFFGLIGFIMGPLVLALFFSVLEVFGSVDNAYPEGESRGGR